MPFHVATAAASYREATEDRLAVHQLDGGVVVVVADGVGGASGGGRAADLAVKIVGEAIEHGAFNRFSANPWVELLIHADAIIASDRHAGETTIVVVAIAEDGHVVGASCGDSGAALVGADGRLDDLTAKQHKRRRWALDERFRCPSRGPFLTARSSSRRTACSRTGRPR